MADDNASTNDLTIKQQREKRRAEKVAALKAKQAAEKRNRRLGMAGAIVGGVAVIAVIVGIVVTSPEATPPVDPSTIEIEGLETFEGLEATHVETAVDYTMSPPAGGPHNPAWLNCGIYELPVPAENAVHSLEHGAVWVTYDPEAVTGADLDALRSAMPRSYIILSPFEGLQSPVVASAWGVQVALDGVDDPRLNDFIVKYRQSADAPEPGALCSQAVDGPGKIS